MLTFIAYYFHYIYSLIKNHVMIQKNLVLLILLTAPQIIFAQSGSLKGTIYDQNTNEPLPFAAITLLEKETIIKATTADLDGRFNLEKIPNGKYAFVVKAVGYDSFRLNGLIIKEGCKYIKNAELEISPREKNPFQLIPLDYPPFIKDENIRTGKVIIDKASFIAHLEKIIKIPEIRDQLSPGNEEPKKYLISLEDNTVFSGNGQEAQCHTDNYTINVLPISNQIFRTQERYLRVFNPILKPNSILYEMITRTNNEEVYCLLEISPKDINGELQIKEIFQIDLDSRK